MRPPQTRRTVLSTLGSALPVALAGCLAGTPTDSSVTGDDSSAGESPTDDSPTNSPTTAEPTPRDRPDVSCATAGRPPEAAIGDRETPTASSRYPTRPESLADESAVAEYLTAYERAYRRNALAERYPDELTTAGVPLGSTRQFPSREGSVVVRVRYQYYYEYSSDPETTATIHADSATTYATYYLDDRVLVRAEETGRLADESALRPDPWDSGEVVECWE